MKDLLDRSLFDLAIEIKELGVFSDIAMEEQIEQLSQRYTILCIVGTINPKVARVPFIGIDEVVSGKAVDVIRTLYKRPVWSAGSNPSESGFDLPPSCCFFKGSLY